MATTMTIDRIRVWSFVRIAFPINFVVGLIIGIVVSPIVSVVAAAFYATVIADMSPFAATTDPPAWLGSAMLIPLFVAAAAAIANTALGLLTVATFNVIAGIVGGVEVSIAPTESKSRTIRAPEPTAIPAPARAPAQRYVGAPPPPPPIGSRPVHVTTAKTTSKPVRPSTDAMSLQIRPIRRRASGHKRP